MHKSQGFGNFGGRRGAGPRTDSFTLLGGEPATKDILDGVDTTWARVPGGAEVATARRRGGREVQPEGPRRQRPRPAGDPRSGSASLPADPVVAEKRRQLDRAIQGCLGLVVETTVPHAEVVPGEVLHLRHAATVAAERPRPLAGGVLSRARAGRLGESRSTCTPS